MRMADRSPSTAAGRPYVSKISVAEGKTKEEDITVTGIRIGVDLLDSVIALKAGVPTDITSQMSITGNGVIQASEEGAKEASLLVFWRQRVPLSY